MWSALRFCGSWQAAPIRCKIFRGKKQELSPYINCTLFLHKYQHIYAIFYPPRKIFLRSLSEICNILKKQCAIINTNKAPPKNFSGAYKDFLVVVNCYLTVNNSHYLLSCLNPAFKLLIYDTLVKERHYLGVHVL